MYKYFTIFALLVIFLSSCSDNNSSSPTKEKILPMTIGSWWLYNNYEIDENNTKTKDSGYDSSVVVSITEILDKEATVFTIFSKNDNGEILNSTDHFYNEDNGRLYMHSGSLNAMFNTSFFPIQLNEQWMKVADRNENNWLVYDQTIVPTIGPLGITIDGKLLIIGRKGDNKKFTVDGKDITADEYKLEINITGQAFTVQFPDLKFPVVINSEMKLYFAQGVGLVCQSMEPTTLPMVNFTLPGFETVLRNYRIK